MGTVRLGRFVMGILGVGFFAGYLAIALEMPAGGVGNPGPGLWPTIVGITGLAMSAMLSVEAIVLPDSASGNIDFPRGKKLFQVSSMLGLTAVYIFAVPILGQLLGSFIFFALVIKLLSQNNWLKIVLYAALASGLIYYCFAILLGLRLPAGFLGFGM